MPPSLTRQAANAVTALRIGLTPLFVWSVWRTPSGGAWEPAVLFGLIAVSDFVDGRIARRFGAQSDGGRVLDHAADITFILAAFGSYVALGIAPWWVPASIAAAFATYVVDSLLRSGPRPLLIGSRIGHLGGVANWTLIGVLVGNESVGLAWLPAWFLQLLFALVPLYCAASILSRVAPRAAARAAS